MQEDENNKYDKELTGEGGGGVCVCVWRGVICQLLVPS